jgi:hypothetical protein
MPERTPPLSLWTSRPIVGRSIVAVRGPAPSYRKCRNIYAQATAADESPRTTKLYDRTGDKITLDEVERITI